MTKQAFNQDLLQFLDQSPTPFHATEAMKNQLLGAGFQALDEKAPWTLEPDGQYFVTRNDSSIIAFRLGGGSPVNNGFRMIGAHTDSPCLRVKPAPVIEKNSYVQLGVEVYGGVLLNPWFDRDLSLAGRMTYRNEAGELISELINIEKPVAIIPSLAIHLDREANKKRSINEQTFLPPILGVSSEQKFDLKSVLNSFISIQDGCEILDYELSFYDSQSAAMIGLNDEFIASARLDNLLSCFVGLRTIIESKKQTCQLLVCNDHEEVGSGSTSGARGNFLRSVLNRIAGSEEDTTRMLANSMLVSTDNAHGVHPNFSDKHDSNHGPVINRGPVIKINNNQAYASNSETSGLFRHAAAQADVPVQVFVTRTDLGCGSTIGPLTATALGVRTVDVGVPTFAMHSIRELAGSEDAFLLQQALLAFYGLSDLSVRTV